MESSTHNRGFASMDRERQREIARKGGKAAHEKGTAHEFTADEARAAGRKGGERVSSDRAHMSKIGRLGGKSSAGRRSKSSPDTAEAEGGTQSHSHETSHTEAGEHATAGVMHSHLAEAEPQHHAAGNGSHG